MLITNAALVALRTSFKKTFNDAFKEFRAESFYKTVAFTAPSGSRSNSYGWLGEFPGLREWVGDRVIKDIKEDSYEIVNRLWEDTVSVKRTDIEDDNLGMYSGMVQGLAEAAGRHPDELIAELMTNGTANLCYDGQYFFDTDHPVYPNHDGTGVAVTVSNFNDGTGPSGTDVPGPTWYLLDARRTFKPFIFQERQAAEFDALTSATDSDQVFMKDLYIYGARARHAVGYGFWQMAYASRAPLTAANFEEARLAMRSVTADGGRPLGIKPSIIVVPPALQSDADRLFKTIVDVNGASNPHYKAVEVLDPDWLQ